MLPQEECDARRERLGRLRQRLLTVTLRSRSLRLTRASPRAAIDLDRLRRVSPRSFDALLAALGREGTGVAVSEVTPRAAAARELADDLAAIAHAARAVWQETGVQELAVGWPFLEGKTADGAWIRGPLLLFPVTLAVGASGVARWELTPAGAAELNEALAHVLARGHGARLAVDRFEALSPGDPKGLERVAAALSEAEVPLAAIAATAGFEALEARSADDRDAAPAGRLTLRPHLVLGRFPRSDSAILADYDKLLAGDLGDAALGAAARLLAVEARDDGSTDATAGPEVAEAGASVEAARWRVFASDTSQDTALAHAAGAATGADGLVVQGPPGTGKSQMIANLVAEAIAAGRRVLVVCQKRAALDVVASRLASVGLREPVAVVYDVQRDRAEVIEALAHTLASCEGAASATRSDQAQEAVEDERAHALHAGRAAARIAVAQEAFAVVAGRPGGPPGLAVLFERSDDDGRPLPALTGLVDGLTEPQVAAELPQVETLCRQTAAFAPPHPLAARSEWSAKDEAARRAVFDRLRALRARIDALAAAPRGALSAGAARDLAELWAGAAGLLDVFAAGDTAGMKGFALAWTWAGGDAEHGDWRRVTARLEEARGELRSVPPELFTARTEELSDDLAALARLEALQARWYRGFTPEFWRLRRRPAEILARCPSLEVRSLDLDAARSLCDMALRWQGLVAELPSDDGFWGLGLGGALDDLDRALEGFRAVHGRIAAARELHRALAHHGGAYGSLEGLAESVIAHGAEAPFFAAALRDRARGALLASVEAAVAALRDDFAEDFLVGIAAACAADDVTTAREGVDRVLGAEAEAHGAAEVDRLLAGRSPWVRAFLRGYRPGPTGDPGSDALRALDRAWTRAALGDRTLASWEEALVDDGHLARLADDLAACRRYAGRGALARYRQRLAATARDPRRGPGLRRLTADAAKRRNRPTLRQLVERHWDAGLSLARPVWLCSPEAVSALFPLGTEVFDVVVADEASQCPVEAAVPAFARARRALVAGDDQQMPPSHFFRAALPDDDSDDDDEPVLASASLLGLARVSFPGLVLRWHYRSRHEALIAFSNRAFYGGRLITAPYAGRRAAPFEGLHWEEAAGRWVDQTNLEEARRVVDVVAGLLAHDGPESPPTVGVVAFNRKQAEAIERLIDRRAAEDEVFRRRWARDQARPAVEQLFVRNLENVQGDERDVIVLSLGYAPGEDGGRVQARFGPVGAEGGERRLNVAVTRARLGLHVVSSIDPAALDVSATKNLGPKLLKAWLAFVRAFVRAGGDPADAELRRQLDLAAALGGARGVTATTPGDDPRRRTGDRVRDALAAALRARGLRAQTDVGIGHLRIDLAVGRPDEEGFRVGVDCTRFLRDADPLSRDVYVPGFWRRLGWRVLRVTPGMWRTRRDEVLARVESLVGESAPG